MSTYESAVQRCPNCRRRFRVLADEVGTHDCPSCGCEPHQNRNEELETALRTEYILPPIPDRSNDWRAWADGYEESGPYGYGRTEADAIVNLKEQLELRCKCGNNGGGDCDWCQIREAL